MEEEIEKRKEYNDKGMIIFEVEYLNGEMQNGKGEEYNNKGK